jgi:hypothetical protein
VEFIVSMQALVVVYACILLHQLDPVSTVFMNDTLTQAGAAVPYELGYDGGLVSIAENTVYDSIDICYASCTAECTSPNVCKCYYQDLTKTKTYSKCSLCSAGSYKTNDTSDACVPCEAGTFNNISSWFPMQITYKSTLYTFTGVFSDGFPIYNHAGRYYWWWVYSWIEYFEKVGGNYGFIQSGPGGYYENGEYSPIQHLSTIAAPVSYCMPCPAGTYADKRGSSVCKTCNTASCPVGFNKTSCESTRDSQCVSLTPPRSLAGIPPTAPAHSTSSESMSTTTIGIISGSVVGGVLLLAGVGVAVYYYRAGPSTDGATSAASHKVEDRMYASHSELHFINVRLVPGAEAHASG